MFRRLRCGFHHYTSGRGSISKKDIPLKFDSRVIFTSRIPTVAPPAITASSINSPANQILVINPRPAPHRHLFSTNCEPGPCFPAVQFLPANYFINKGVGGLRRLPINYHPTLHVLLFSKLLIQSKSKCWESIVCTKPTVKKLQKLFLRSADSIVDQCQVILSIFKFQFIVYFTLESSSQYDKKLSRNQVIFNTRFIKHKLDFHVYLRLFTYELSLK